MTEQRYARRPIWHLVRTARVRWTSYVGAALISAILVVFPPLYVSRAKVVPQNTGIGDDTGKITTLLGGQAQNTAMMPGDGRGSNDLNLIIGRSDSVVAEVIESLGLAGPEPSPGEMNDARIDLARKVDVHLLLGGVLEIETTSHDPAEAQRLTAAYVGAIGRQLARFEQQRSAKRNPRNEPQATESVSYVRVIDPPRLDPQRHWNRSAMALLAGVALLAFFLEWYAPATGLFRLDPAPARQPGAAL